MLIPEYLNQTLQSILNTSSARYKSLISNPDGVEAGTVVKPIDLNKGRTAELLEYLNRLGVDLSKQIYLNEATGKYLEIHTNKVYKIFILDGESTAEHVARIQRYVLARKISKAAIILEARQYSSTEPEIQVGPTDVAFADVSFSDFYSSFEINQPELIEMNGWWVLPAITGGSGSNTFFFILVLTDTQDSDVLAIIEMLDRWIAAGIRYQVRIEYTP